VPELDLAELTEATGGKLVRGNPETRVDSYVIDTRRLVAGGAFFALAGNRTDGHEFLTHAADRGAAVAVVQHEPGEDQRAPEALIVVEDSAAALASTGRWLRKRLSRPKWIAVTGSNGKTTTKEMIAEALAGRHRVHRTPGNFNNELGVPLSLLACPSDIDFAVLELAATTAGDIALLAQMTEPDVGVVTNVRAAHLATFGTLDDVAAAKGELFAVLRDDATSVVNLDDPHVRVQSTRHAGRRVTFGQAPGSDLRLADVRNQFLPGAELSVSHEGKVRKLRLRVGGAHSAFNALASMAVVHALGEDLDAAVEGIERFEPGPGRGKVHHLERNIQLVDESYNSSPAALASVLDTLRLSEPRGRKVLVVGDMLELGRVEGALHRAAGKRAAQAGVRVLFTVGPLARVASETARRAGVAEVYHYSDSTRASESIPEFVKDGDLIVVKGSRSVRLERVVDALRSAVGEAG
jgi:UDP-N-acetylmuramoyl-tripeptide--D-alanyl-D-alanine ligase